MSDSTVGLSAYILFSSMKYPNSTNIYFKI